MFRFLWRYTDTGTIFIFSLLRIQIWVSKFSSPDPDQYHINSDLKTPQTFHNFRPKIIVNLFTFFNAIIVQMILKNRTCSCLFKNSRLGCKLSTSDGELETSAAPHTEILHFGTTVRQVPQTKSSLFRFFTKTGII